MSKSMKEKRMNKMLEKGAEKTMFGNKYSK